MFSDKVTRIYCLMALLLIQGVFCKEISRIVTGFTRPETKSTKESSKETSPSLTRDRLDKIRSFDRMKCFPRVLCTLTKADAFKHFGAVDLNRLADGYLNLLSAFPGGPQMKSGSEDDLLSLMMFKQDIVDENHSTSDEAEMDMSPLNMADSDQGTPQEDENGDIVESEEKEMLLTDPLLHQKEKMEMKKLMAELLEEETGVNDKTKPFSWTETALSLPIKIPLQIGTSLFKSVLIPLLTDRKRRDLSDKHGRKLLRVKHEEPLKSAMVLWKGLKDVKECGRLFPTCPFEAWEVVSMIKLVGDESRQRRNLVNPFKEV